MKRIARAAQWAAALTALAFGPWAQPASANPPGLCQYGLGDRNATIACGSDPLAEPGMAGNMPAPTAAPSGSGIAPGAQTYLSELEVYVHPKVSSNRLIELGNLACSARRSGMSSDDARMILWDNLKASGVTSSNAETGTLVHVAVDNLCPEVGYP